MACSEVVEVINAVEFVLPIFLVLAGVAMYQCRKGSGS